MISPRLRTANSSTNTISATTGCTKSWSRRSSHRNRASAAFDQRVETFQRERQVRAALVPGDSMDFVNDDDIALIWLQDQSLGKQVTDYLNTNALTLFMDESLAATPSDSFSPGLSTPG